MGREFKLINMLLAEGALEILECIEELEVARFGDFKRLRNGRTGKVFSANTLSSRLKELASSGAIDNTVIESRKQRKVVGYKITANGKKALRLAIKYENELEKILKPNKIGE
ncbi:MAG: hypothetical protein ABIH83_01325 [Candidatus Micrarchaeota archaeon]